MADHRVNQLLILINEQVEFWENQSVLLSKARAMMDVALGSVFQECTRLVVHDYLSALDDILENALGLSEASLSLLLTCLKQCQPDTTI